jgi:chromosomal replication initiation ATPase DnaA
MTPFLKQLVVEAAKRRGTTVKDVLSRSHRRVAVLARRDVWLAAYQRNPLVYSTPALGRHFDRDASTVWVGIHKHQERRVAAVAS